MESRARGSGYGQEKSLIANDQFIFMVLEARPVLDNIVVDYILAIRAKTIFSCKCVKCLTGIRVDQALGVWQANGGEF